MPVLRQAIKKKERHADMDVTSSICWLLTALMTGTDETAIAVAAEICKTGQL